LGIAVYFQTTHCLSSDPCDCVTYDFNWGRPLFDFHRGWKRSVCFWFDFMAVELCPNPSNIHGWTEKLKT
jgi:hypothetical protein